MVKETQIVAPTGEVASAQPMLVTLEQLQSIVNAAVSGSRQGDGDGALQVALKALTDANENVRRVQDKNNPNPPQLSVFEHPEGGLARPKAKFRQGWTYTMCGVRLWEDQLTPLEIDLLNRIESTKEARNGTWKAIVEKSGTTTKVAVSVPARNQDDRGSLPPFAQILTELLDGKDAADPQFMLQEIARLRKQVEDSMAAKVA